MHGGGYECGMCFGILFVYQIVGMGEVYCIVKEEMVIEMECLCGLCNCLWNGIKDIEEVYLNGDLEYGVLNIFNVSFNYVEGELLIMVLKDFVVFFGFVCMLVSFELFYVLCVLGLNDELVHSFICFFLGCFIIEEEIDYIIELVCKFIGCLCDFFLLWEMYKQGVDLNSIEWVYY